MSQLQHIQKKNIAVLKDTLRIATQTNQIAIDTNLQLHSQGKKMEHMNGTLGKINNQVDKSENTAKEINSYWYYLKNKVKKVLGIQKKLAYQQEDKEQKPQKFISCLPEGSTDQEKKMMQMIIKQDGEEQQLTDELLRKIKQMKGHSKDMGTELDHHNDLISKMDIKADRANSKISKVNGILNKIMRK